MDTQKRVRTTFLDVVYFLGQDLNRCLDNFVFAVGSDEAETRLAVFLDQNEGWEVKKHAGLVLNKTVWRVEGKQG